MSSMEEVLNEINGIIKTLQDSKWSEHSESLLLSAQGKLAVYQANVSGYLAEAIESFAMSEQEAKFKEEDEFLKNILNGETQAESRAKAKTWSHNQKKDVIKLKRVVNDLKGILDAVTSIQTAIQVQLRTHNREATYASKLSEC